MTRSNAHTIATIPGPSMAPRLSRVCAPLLAYKSAVHFPNPVVAEGILDRLVNCAFHVPMEGKSYRPHKRPG